MSINIAGILSFSQSICNAKVTSIEQSVSATNFHHIDVKEDIRNREITKISGGGSARSSRI